MKGTLTGRCETCLEHHPGDDMCPPVEVRTTGHAWFQLYMKELEAEVERLQKLEGTDDHPENKCDRCGGCNITWHTRSDLWNQIAGDWSILCPICFVGLAEKAGLDCAWQLSSIAAEAGGETER